MGLSLERAVGIAVERRFGQLREPDGRVVYSIRTFLTESGLWGPG